MWSTLSSSMELTICQSDRGMSIIKGNIIKKNHMSNDLQPQYTVFYNYICRGLSGSWKYLVILIVICKSKKLENDMHK